MGVQRELLIRVRMDNTTIDKEKILERLRNNRNISNIININEINIVRDKIVEYEEKPLPNYLLLTTDTYYIGDEKRLFIDPENNLYIDDISLYRNIQGFYKLENTILVNLNSVNANKIFKLFTQNDKLKVYNIALNNSYYDKETGMKSINIYNKEEGEELYDSIKTLLDNYKNPLLSSLFVCSLTRRSEFQEELNFNFTTKLNKFLISNINEVINSLKEFNYDDEEYISKYDSLLQAFNIIFRRMYREPLRSLINEGLINTCNNFLELNIAKKVNEEILYSILSIYSNNDYLSDTISNFLFKFNILNRKIESIINSIENKDIKDILNECFIIRGCTVKCKTDIPNIQLSRFVNAIESLLIELHAVEDENERQNIRDSIKVIFEEMKTDNIELGRRVIHYIEGKNMTFKYNDEKDLVVIDYLYDFIATICEHMNPRSIKPSLKRIYPVRLSKYREHNSEKVDMIKKVIGLNPSAFKKIKVASLELSIEK